MWIYEKKLQYPVNIKQTNARLAKAIITQYGGPDGELNLCNDFKLVTICR
jgi:spore coat protein JC